MKIAYVVPRYLPHRGGVETHVAQIARRLARSGHHVDVLTPERDAGLSPVEVIDGVRVRRFPTLLSGTRYEFAPGLITYLARRSSAYDMLHAHSYHALPSLQAALTSRLPLVFTPHYHGTGHTRLGRFLHLPYRLPGAIMFRRARAVICVSHAEAALVRSHFPHVAGRITIIPNGVEIDSLRAAEPYHGDGRIILTVARLLGSKNVDRVIRALAHLDDAFALVVIGEGPDRAALEDLARGLDLDRRVRFLGLVDDESLRRWYRTASVYVSMSRQEAFGMTLTEACAAGARVIASDIPTHREVLAGVEADGIRLLPLNTSCMRLAEAIRELADSPRSMTIPAGVMSWDTVAVQTLALYERSTGAR